MNQEENCLSPLLNSNIGLGKIGEIPGATMQKIDFRLVFTYAVLVALGRSTASRLFDTTSVSSLLSLLSFQIGTNTIPDNIPTYYVLGFRKQNLHLPLKKKRVGSP